MARPIRCSLPPGPRLPRLVQTVVLSALPSWFVEACRRHYGDLITFSTLLDSSFVLVLDPELVRQVFQAPPKQLRNTAIATARVDGERSVLFQDGPAHLRLRRLLLPPFHGERMRAYETVMREATDRAIDSWPVGKRFALLPSMRSLTLDVISRVVFGLEDDFRRNDLKQRLGAMMEPVAPPARPVRVLTRHRAASEVETGFEQRRRAVDDLIYAEIDARRRVADLAQREDVLSTLLVAEDEAGTSLTDEEIRDQLVTLLTAGHETTATSLSWAFDLLLGHPAALRRLTDELAAGDDGYLKAVVMETLRVRPLVPSVSRVVSERSYELGGYRLPVDTQVRPSISGIHFRADRYPDPRAFRPERFLGNAGRDTHAWLPFGGGTRRCLGASFARFEMEVVIRRVLARTRLAPAGRRRERAVRKRITPRRGITFVPRRGVPVLQPRPPRPAVRGAPGKADRAAAVPELAG
jgi:cytochrome P450 family 135